MTVIDRYRQSVRTGWYWRSTSTTRWSPTAWRSSCDPGSGWPRSAWSCSARPGPVVVQAMIDDGFRVFLDLKLADIPTTVNRAARVLGALGVSYLTLHAFGGPGMLRAGVEGLAEGAARPASSRPPPWR